MLNRLSIRAKLTLLAGAPVLGALALASLLWLQAQRGAKSAEALGSVDDLAELSVGLATLAQELQAERALSALVLGYSALAKAEDPLGPEAPERAKQLADEGRAPLAVQRQATDLATARLQRFLSARNLALLPARLRRDIEVTREALRSLPDVRREVDEGTLDTNRNVEYFRDTNLALIDATAALTQLSDDGELLRSISALVSVMQVKERASQEHALLASVFALGSFPPGSYRVFVGVTTEEQVYVDVLRATARDVHLQLYAASQETPEAKRAALMRKDALDNIDETVDASAAEWFLVKAKDVAALRELELQLTKEVRTAAALKLNEVNAGRRTSLGLSAAVLLVSTFLAWWIARGINASVGSLSGAAAKVQRDNDFSVRAVRASNDELGRLTTAFNDMLGGIQERDRELDEYRQALEQKVEARTKELRDRNAAMRLVLDNVDQGLATIRRDGTLATERSAAFDTWFGAPGESANFAEHIAKRAPRTREVLDLAWDQVVDGFLPLDFTIGQMPTRLDTDDRRYALAYKPIASQGQFEGALLVISDVTEEEARRRRDAEQSEHIAVFEHLMQDRAGFVSFFKEGERLLERIFARSRSLDEVKRDVHTLKGNCAFCSVQSVATVCHEVESLFGEAAEIDPNQLAPIRAAWDRFSERVRPLVGAGADVLALERKDLDGLLEAVRARNSHADLQARVERLECDPVSMRFFRAGEQAKRLARRLGKPEPNILIDANDVRLPPDVWAPFWVAFTHVVQNAVDHGLESEKERIALAKPRAGTLRFSAHSSSTSCQIVFEDDGSGVDWEKVRTRARELGLPADTENDLAAALFADSLSTKDIATATSGRGVGLAAVKSATEALHGRVHVESTRGSGTRFMFEFAALDAAERRSGQRVAAGTSGPRLGRQV